MKFVVRKDRERNTIWHWKPKNIFCKLQYTFVNCSRMLSHYCMQDLPQCRKLFTFFFFLCAKNSSIMIIWTSSFSYFYDDSHRLAPFENNNCYMKLTIYIVWLPVSLIHYKFTIDWWLPSGLKRQKMCCYAGEIFLVSHKPFQLVTDYPGLERLVLWALNVFSISHEQQYSTWNTSFATRGQLKPQSYLLAVLCNYCWFLSEEKTRVAPMNCFEPHSLHWPSIVPIWTLVRPCHSSQF